MHAPCDSHDQHSDINGTSPDAALSTTYEPTSATIFTVHIIVPTAPAPATTQLNLVPVVASPVVQKKQVEHMESSSHEEASRVVEQQVVQRVQTTDHHEAPCPPCDADITLCDSNTPPLADQLTNSTVSDSCNPLPSLRVVACRDHHASDVTSYTITSVRARADIQCFHVSKSWLKMRVTFYEAVHLTWAQEIRHVVWPYLDSG